MGDNVHSVIQSVFQNSYKENNKTDSQKYTKNIMQGICSVELDFIPVHWRTIANNMLAAVLMDFISLQLLNHMLQLVMLLPY